MPQKWCRTFLHASYQEYMMSICIITGDVNPDHLVKVVKSLHYKLTIFSLCN